MNAPKLLSYCILVMACLMLGVDQAAAVEVLAERSEKGVVVRIDGELFAEYLECSGHQPAVWPIIGPTGEAVTRSFPIGPLLDSERDDHGHHHSLWFAHEDVNGHNFWIEPRAGQDSATANIIKHVEFTKLESKGSQAVLVARNQWLAGEGNLVCEDERTLVFGAAEDARWIDFTIKILATNGPVTFGDIKDGTFSTRVAGTMKVDSGGTLVNSQGLTNGKAWGMPAEWIDNYGQVAGNTVGLAMFSHPSNFRHPTRWHVRNYGLLCANPFGERQFPEAAIKQTSYTIEAGGSLTLRYRVYLHKGNTSEGKVAEAFQRFASEPQIGEPLPLLYESDFEQAGMERWTVSDAEFADGVWNVQPASKPPADGQQTTSYLRVAGQSKYEPPHRSPHSYALVKDTVVGDFTMTARVQNTNVNAGDHRDLCLFWGYQDPAHFYYVHLGAKPDPHSSQIFIVDDAARKMITTNKSAGIPWRNDWHQVKVTRDVTSGLMQVFFDDMVVPVLTAEDTRFTWGRVGLGTFDDHGNFDDFKLYGEAIEPIPAAAKLP